MREIIERFRYRFQLWRREQREDLLGPPGTHLADFFDHTSVYAQPKYAVLLTESTPRAVVRSVDVYFRHHHHRCADLPICGGLPTIRTFRSVRGLPRFRRPVDAWYDFQHGRPPQCEKGASGRGDQII